MNVWVLSLPAQKKESKKKDIAMVFGDMQEFCLAWFSVNNLNVIFLVVVILVVHVSYYITVYLNDVKSCIWSGYVCARRRCEMNESVPEDALFLL